VSVKLTEEKENKEKEINKNTNTTESFIEFVKELVLEQQGGIY
jgi:hypothetical protein